MKKRFRGPSWEGKSGEGMKCDDTKKQTTSANLVPRKALGTRLNICVGDYFPLATNLNGCITCKPDNINLQQFCSFKVPRIHLDLW